MDVVKLLLRISPCVGNYITAVIFIAKKLGTGVM